MLQHTHLAFVVLALDHAAEVGVGSAHVCAHRVQQLVLCCPPIPPSARETL